MKNPLLNSVLALVLGVLIGWLLPAAPVAATATAQGDELVWVEGQAVFVNGKEWYVERIIDNTVDPSMCAIALGKTPSY